MLENFDYKVKRTEDCVLINTNNWIQMSNFEIRKISGKSYITYIAEALDIHTHSEEFTNCPIKKGSYMLLTKVASEVAGMSSFEIDGNKFFNVPIMQVLGIFKNNEISLNNLEMLYNKVLIEKIEEKTYKGLELPLSNEMIGRIIKKGNKAINTNINDVVIVKDNIVTPIRLNEKDYYGLEESGIVGIIKDKSNINFINESILMQPYYFKKLLNSTILETADINYEDLDYSDVYNRDLFQIKYIDSRIEGLKPNDVVLAKRDYTNYVYLNQDKYFLLNGKNWVEAKIGE